MRTLPKITMVAIFVGASFGCDQNGTGDSRTFDEHGIIYQGTSATTQAGIDAIKAMVGQVIKEARDAGFEITKIPNKIYIVNGLPPEIPNVDATNISSIGRMTVDMDTTKDELGSGLLSLGVKDEKSGVLFDPTPNTTLGDLIKIRDLADEVSKHAASKSFTPIEIPEQVIVSKGSESAVDASNVANGVGFLRATSAVTFDDLAIGFFARGLRDVQSGITFFFKEGITFAEGEKARDVVTSVITAETQALLNQHYPLQIFVYSHVDGNVDIHNLGIGWILVSPNLQAEQLRVVLPQQ